MKFIEIQILDAHKYYFYKFKDTFPLPFPCATYESLYICS